MAEPSPAVPLAVLSEAGFPLCPDCGAEIIFRACNRGRPTTAEELAIIHHIALGAHRRLTGCTPDTDTCTVRRADLRRVLLDATRGSCFCPNCVLGRRRIRAAAWPKDDDGDWPEIEEQHHTG